MTSHALFEPAGDACWRATEYSRGPWNPEFCHGGPVSTLLIRAVEGLRDRDQWQVAQHHVELTRPVPVSRPLQLATRVERPGRKVSIIVTALHDGETLVARSRTIRNRRAMIPLPADLPAAGEQRLRPPSDAMPQRLEWEGFTELAYHSHSCEFRVDEGTLSERGPVATWIRLLCDVVPDEIPTGTQRAIAVTDFGNGISASTATDQFTFINPDLSVNFARPPRGEWIGLRATTHYGDPAGGTGLAFAESALFDVDGRMGRATQSLIIEPVDDR